MSSWFLTEQLNDGLIRITEPLVHRYYRANFYRISGRDFDIQLDFGIGLQSLSGISPPHGHPVLAVASHAHVDHIGRFHEYPRRAGHRLEAGTFATLDDAGTVESWFRGLAQPVEQPPYPSWTIADYELKPAPLTEFLDEGDVLDLGDRQFTILHLPGHSPGSIALFDERSGELLSADAIYDGALTDNVPTSDIETYVKTMKRLLELDVAICHGGHGPSFGNARMHAIARDYIASNGG